MSFCWVCRAVAHIYIRFCTELYRQIVDIPMGTVEYSSCFVLVLNLDLYVGCFDALISLKYVYKNAAEPRRELCTRKTGLSPHPII